VKPRLDILGADSSNILAPNGAFSFDDKGFDAIERIATTYKPLFISLDPLLSYIGGNVDVNKGNQVRPFLHRLGDLAQKHGLAILAVRHLTKGARDGSGYRGSGSIDITAVARSVLLAGIDPTDRNRRGLVHDKCNLGPQGPTFGYAISDSGLAWLGPINLTAGELLAAEPGVFLGATASAKDFLLEFLAEGPRRSSEVFAEAEKLRIARRTVERAKSELGLATAHQGVPGKGGGGAWYWSLPVRPDKSGRGRQDDALAELSSRSDKTPTSTSDYVDDSRDRQPEPPTLADSPQPREGIPCETT
jgi:hypothetical protein